MAYKINDKIYTDHALMDEIVYECKKIISGIVIKNDELANNCETKASVENFEALRLVKLGLATFENFPFSEEMFNACGFSYAQINAYMMDRELIPENDRARVLKVSSDYLVDHANDLEENKYYRTLIGLPPLTVSKTPDYDIPYYTSGKKIGYSTVIPEYFIESKWYIDEETGERKFGIDTKLPLHKQTPDVIAIIQNTGGIDILKETYRGSNYTYLDFLGDRSIDLYTARIAAKWDILYFPSVNENVENAFTEFYLIERDLYLKQTYQDAYKYESEYYDQMLIISLLCQVFTDMIVEVPEMYIRRDIFDIRSVQYFLESYDVQFFPEIPIRYQIKIVKRLNTLIKFKSSNRNIEDILNIFNSKDTSIYKYWLYKRRLVQDQKYVTSPANNEEYELQFVMSKLGDTYDNYIKENIYRKPYDDVTLLDKYWDGENTHAVVRDRILAKDFTIQGTKYMAVDMTISMTEYLEQLQFFVGMVIDSDTHMDDFKVIIPMISEYTALKVSDLFLFLMAISDMYEGVEQNIVLPPDVVYPWNIHEGLSWEEKYYTQVDGGYYDSINEEYNVIIDGNPVRNDRGSRWKASANAGHVAESEVRMHDEILDWKKYWYSKEHRKTDYIAPGMYETRHNYVFSFNTVDLDQLASIIGQRHSRFGFERGYTLEDLGIDGYINPGDVTITNGADLVDIYQNNIEIYRQLKERISGRLYNDDDYNTIKASDEDQYRVMMYVFRTLFMKKLDYNRYKLSDGTYAHNLGEVLRNRDYIIYNYYDMILNEPNPDLKKDTIRQVIDNILNVLEYYIQGDGLDYIYNFCSVVSFDAILRYILMIVNFFKSYKVQFLDPFVTYLLDDYIENGTVPQDGIRDLTENYLVNDRPMMDESYKIEDQMLIKDNVLSQSAEEALSVSAHFDPDPYDDYDYDGEGVSEAGKPEPKMADGAYAPDESQYPYVMLNGGKPQLGRLAQWDLDGATPKDFDDEWLDIDGGYPYNPHDEITGWFGTQGFNYIIDGGSPSMKFFQSRTMKLVIIDNQIQANVLISRADYQRLVLKEDGIYMEDIWQDYTDFNEWITSTDYAMSAAVDYLYNAFDRMVEISDLDKVEGYIDQQIYNDTKSMIKVIEYTEGGVLWAKAKEYIDQEVEKMHEDYDDFTALGFWNTI